MIVDRCDHFKGLIALDVVGQLTDDERVALTAHLDGCPLCRDEHHTLKALGAVLPAGDPDHFDEEEIPFGLQTKVLERLRAESRRERARRRTRYSLGGAAAAAVAAIAMVFGFAGGSSNVRTLSLSGPDGTHATVRLTGERWGTAVDLQGSAYPKNEILWVTMRTESGSWWVTGTYRTVAHGTVHVDMACALPLSQIEGVSVHDSKGATVMHGYVN